MAYKVTLKENHPRDDYPFHKGQIRFAKGVPKIVQKLPKNFDLVKMYFKVEEIEVIKLEAKTKPPKTKKKSSRKRK